MTTFKKAELTERFNFVKNVISKNSTIPSLTMMHISILGNKYQITGCNGEMQVTAHGECDGVDHIECCADPSTFGVMLSSAKQDINMTMKDAKLSTISGSSKFNIKTIDSDLYPMLSMTGNTNNVNLRELISGVNKASAIKDVRTGLTGTCINADGKMLHAAATDGSMIMRNQINCDIDAFDIILPPQSAEYLSQIDTYGFYVDRGSLKAECKTKGIEIITKLIDAKFPDYQRLITDYANKFTINRQDLIDKVASMSKIDSVKEKGVTIKSDGDKLKISVADIASDEIDFSGDKFLANFNPSYLLTALNFIDSESITIEFNNDFYIQGKEEGRLFLITPRRM